MSSSFCVSLLWIQPIVTWKHAVFSQNTLVIKNIFKAVALFNQIAGVYTMSACSLTPSLPVCRDYMQNYMQVSI